MARQERNDVDYFPHYVSHGKKMFYLRSKYKNDGYAVWFMLLEELGKSDYHYLNLSDEIQMMYLSSQMMVEKEILLEIIETLVKFGEFDAYLWNEHRILFNEEFVEEIRDAYEKRKNEIITKKSLLTRLASLGVRIEQKTADIEPNLTLKDPGNTQTKVEYSRVDKTKVEDRQNLAEIFISDLPNSSELQRISSRTKIPIEKYLAYIPKFKEKKMKLEYKNFTDFCEHFKNSYNIDNGTTSKSIGPSFQSGGAGKL